MQQLPKRDTMKKVIVIGAGIGGLSAAARLVRAGLDVTVLEAHTYPGGCAGTFFYEGFRFDAGATLAGGFYPGGPMDLLGQAAGIEDWGGIPADPVMAVHLPGGEKVLRKGGVEGWEAYQVDFGEKSIPFWKWQKRTADAMWQVALKLPPWPPQTARDVKQLALIIFDWMRQGGHTFPLLQLGLDAFRMADVHMKYAPEKLRLFIDAQLLISAQAESSQSNALYAASALDLPDRGVVHLQGGMGSIGGKLVKAIRENGGKVFYRQEAVRIQRRGGIPVGVETDRGCFEADVVIANLTPWNLRALLKDDLPRALKRLPPNPERGWGAFTIYAGIDESVLPKELPLHHQIVTGRPLGEGNSIFLSISPGWDKRRAPSGKRAATLSTHTDYKMWWDLYNQDPEAYQECRNRYVERIMQAVGKVLPGFQESAVFLLPGTPKTFQHFTRRASGWVGGFPQTSLFSTMAPLISERLWMVGDSIFPGQSTAAVALGGLRVAEAVLQDVKIHRRNGRR
jgi:C-3',4' desaturase CrtD